MNLQMVKPERKPKYRQWKRKELKQLRSLLAEGKKPRQIAEIMGISTQRVYNAKQHHVKRIRRPIQRRKPSVLPPPARLPRALLAGLSVGVLALLIIAFQHR